MTQYRVEMRDSFTERWEAIGEDPPTDAVFGTEAEAEAWIGENLIYRADEEPQRSEYRIVLV